MIMNNDNQYFLIINKANLFPELSESPIVMIEQIMNALLISNSDNIHYAIESIVKLHKISSNLLNDKIINILDALYPFLKQHELSYCNGDAVRFYYPRYNNKSLFYRDIGKQVSMNVEFALQKKISFLNGQIKFEDTFYSFVYDLVEQQRKHDNYNLHDIFITQHIEPLTLNHRVKMLEIIKHETNKYKKALLGKYDA